MQYGYFVVSQGILRCGFRHEIRCCIGSVNSIRCVLKIIGNDGLCAIVILINGRWRAMMKMWKLSHTDVCDCGKRQPIYHLMA